MIKDILYMIAGIGFMLMVLIVGIVGGIKLYKDIKRIPNDDRDRV